MSEYVIAALYKFVTIDDYAEWPKPLRKFFNAHGVLGTLLLAPEGINGTIAGTREGIDAALDYLRTDPRLSDLEHKESYAEECPFHRLKIKLKKEIVTIGLPEIDPTAQVGTYVPPQAWNELISDPDVYLIDTRNDFEVQVGSFEGAVNPFTLNFRDFPAYVKEHLDPQKQPKVAMFCTGGIRCEKATSLLLDMGFDEVYHLQGGILKYLEEIPQENSMWHGECFVFDHRVTVDHDLNPGTYELCYGCKRPLSPTDREHPRFEAGICCELCADTITPEQRAARTERQKQVELAAERGIKHIGWQRKGTI